MFAYCNNNPVVSIDEWGQYPYKENRPEADYITLDNLNSGTGAGVGTVAGVGIAGFIYAFSGLVDALWRSVSKSFARTGQRSYKTGQEEHHVVARNSVKVNLSAAILNQMLPQGVENPINKMMIKTGLHRRLHTNLYYGMTNVIIVNAYCSGSNYHEQRANVISAICMIRGIVWILNTMAPY